jgi:putative transposase
MDLRERVVHAVEREGMSRQGAAARFGIGVKTAIDWVRHFRETGRLAALPRGGRRPKKLVGEYRDWLLQRCRERDFTLRGLVAELAERSLRVDYRVVWAFVHAEKLSHKKDADCPGARSSGCGAPASPMADLSEPDRSGAPGLHR